MSERDEKQREIQRDPIGSPRPKAPIISGLSERGARSVSSLTLTLPTVLGSAIKEASSHDSRPSVLAQLDLHKRTILKSEGVDELDGAKTDAATGVNVSSTSEPPPNLGQALPLPEALRAVAQASLSPFAFEAAEHFEWETIDSQPSIPAARDPEQSPVDMGQEALSGEPDATPLNELLSLDKPAPTQERNTGRELWTPAAFVLSVGLSLTLAALFFVNQKRISAEQQAVVAENDAKLASSRLYEQLNQEKKRSSAEEVEQRLEQEHAVEAMRQAIRAQLENEQATLITELRDQLEVATRKRKAIEAERDQAERDSWTAYVKRKESEAELARVKAELEKTRQGSMSSSASQ